jgi:hypothetical protein
MKLAAISAKTLISSTMITAGSEAVTSDINDAPIFVVQSNFASISPEVFGFGFSSPSTIAPSVAPGQWNWQTAQRFKELSRIEAIGVLTVEEWAELETLTRLRRMAEYPRTADEILWQRRQNSVTRGLIQAVQKYVEFHESTDHP